MIFLKLTNVDKVKFLIQIASIKTITSNEEGCIIRTTDGGIEICLESIERIMGSIDIIET